jgi:predicted nucleic acid-binding protein
MTRVVIDANVLASAAAGHPDSPSRRLLAALTTRQVEATLCERLLEELARTLERPYFSRRVTPDERRRFDLTLRIVSEMLPDPYRPKCFATRRTTTSWRSPLPVAPRPS